MADTKKTVAKATTANTEAKAEATVAAKAAEKVEAKAVKKAPAKKAPEKKEAAKKAPAKKAEAKKAPAKKAAAKKTTAKKAVKSNALYVVNGENVTAADLEKKYLETAKDRAKYDLGVEDVKTVEIYINLSEQKVYSVINGEIEDNFEMY